MKKLKLTAIAFCISLAVFASCSMNNAVGGWNGAYRDAAMEGLGFYGEMDGETYFELEELPFVNTENEAESYFSMDSNTAAYPNLRRMINEGQPINKNAVRTDELLNYFSYSIPDSGDTFSAKAELSVAPWNSENYLLTVGVKTKETTLERYSQGNNIVFLIDVSG